MSTVEMVGIASTIDPEQARHLRLSPEFQQLMEELRLEYSHFTGDETIEEEAPYRLQEPAIMTEKQIEAWIEYKAWSAISELWQREGRTEASQLAYAMAIACWSNPDFDAAEGALCAQVSSRRPYYSFDRQQPKIQS